MQSVGFMGVKHVGTGLQSSGDMFSGAANHTSLLLVVRISNPGVTTHVVAAAATYFALYEMH